MKTYIKIISFTVIVLLVISSIIYTYPRKLSREYNGVLYRLGESNDPINVEIKIDGYLSNGLLKGNKFQGDITIGDKQLSKINMRFDKFGRGILSNFDERTGDYSSYGDMYADTSMDHFTICVLEQEEKSKGGKSWSGKDGLMLSAPANNREEALELSKKLMKDYLTDWELK